VRPAHGREDDTMRRTRIAAAAVMVAAGFIGAMASPASGHVLGAQGCDTARGWVNFEFETDKDRNGDGVVCIKRVDLPTTAQRLIIKDNHVHGDVV
jgi:hypothetical protein